MNGYDIGLASKTVCHKLYKNLQSLPIPTHWWKNLSMDFVTGFPLLVDKKGDNYDAILVIVDWLIKTVHYKMVKIMINISGLAKVIIDIVIRHHGLSELIISNCSLLFTSKFWSLLCYFLDIKRKLSTAFHLQTNGQTERQNSKWRHISKLLSIGSRMTRQSYCPWRNLYTTI